MKKLLVTFLLTIVSLITYSQSGVGYVNYTSYKTHNGNGSINQYYYYPNTAAEFDNILNTANSNTTITHTGEVTLATMCNGSTGTPHWGGDWYAIKFEFWFIPKETGSYRFGVNSDDASDLSIDGTIITTYYGGHGAGGYQYSSKNLVAGTRYKIIARYQEASGGDALYVRWSRPSAPTTYSYWNEEVTNINSTPSSKINFYFGGNINPSQWSIKAYTANGVTPVSTTTGLALGTNGSVVNTSDFVKSKTDMFIYLSKLSSTTLTNLYWSVLTVGDAYLAFQELANRGLSGTESNTFISGVQFLNGDIDGNNVFDEKDSYRILQHVIGSETLIVSNWNESNLFRFVKKSTFDGITKANWATTNTPYSATHPLVVDATINDYVYDVVVALKGDVNLSHTIGQNAQTTQSTNRTMNLTTPMEISTYVLSEIVDGKVIVSIKVNTLGQLLKGVQLKLNYDSDILKYENTEYTTSGNPINFSNDIENFINFGSLIYNGNGLLNNNTEYRLIFTPKEIITNTIGLTSIEGVDAINVGGLTLKIKNL